MISDLNKSGKKINRCDIDILYKYIEDSKKIYSKLEDVINIINKFNEILKFKKQNNIEEINENIKNNKISIDIIVDYNKENKDILKKKNIISLDIKDYIKNAVK